MAVDGLGGKSAAYTQNLRRLENLIKTEGAEKAIEVLKADQLPEAPLSFKENHQAEPQNRNFILI